MQVIEEPTCNIGHILDLLLCDIFSSSKLLFHEICPPLAHTCDHYGLLFKVNLVTSTASDKAAFLPDFKNACYDTICTKLFAIDWSFVISSCNDNIQTLYDTLIRRLHLVIDHYVSLKKSSNISPKRPLQIRKLLKEKKKLYPLRKINLLTKENYNKTSKNYDQAVLHRCDKIESSICENPNLSKFYGFADRKLKANFTLPYLKTESGSIVQDDEELPLSIKFSNM